MNHLTNLYKHQCEQLEEQIYNMKKMLSEAQGTRDPTVIRKPKKDWDIEHVQPANAPLNPTQGQPNTPVKPQTPRSPFIPPSAVPMGVPGYYPPIPASPQPADRDPFFKPQPTNPKPMPKPTVYNNPLYNGAGPKPIDSAIEYLQQGLQTFGPEYNR